MKVLDWLKRNWLLIGCVVIGIVIGVLVMQSLYQAATSRGYARSDFFAFVNLIVDIFVTPATLVALLVAIHDLRQLVAKPNLALFFPNEATEKVLNRPNANNPRHTQVLLELRNTGNAIAKWYSVEIVIPDEISPHDTSVVQGRGTRNGHWTATTKASHVHVTYRSDGTAAVFLEYPLEIFNFNIFVYPDREYKKQYQASYVIASDWGKPRRGVLIFQLAEL